MQQNLNLQIILATLPTYHTSRILYCGRKKTNTCIHVWLSARRWLCVCATSTLSEHVLSNCGVASTAKRSKLNGSCLKSQIRIQNNMKGVCLTVDNIMNTL